MIPVRREIKTITAFVLCLGLSVLAMAAYCLQETALKRVLAVVTYPTNVKMIGFLATNLLVGLVVLYDLSREPDV